MAVTVFIALCGACVDRFGSREGIRSSKAILSNLFPEECFFCGAEPLYGFEFGMPSDAQSTLGGGDALDRPSGE